MFDTLLPPIYKWLRRRAELSQGKLARELGAGRTSIYNFEHGRARPTPEQEARMLELAGCSDEELGERLLDGISEALERPAGELNVSRAVARKARGRVSPSLLRALANEIEAVEQAALAYARARRNLGDLASAIDEQMQGRVPVQGGMPVQGGKPEQGGMPQQGATGRGVRPVFHTSGRDAGRDRENPTERKETKR